MRKVDPWGILNGQRCICSVQLYKITAHCGVRRIDDGKGGPVRLMLVPARSSEVLSNRKLTPIIDRSSERDAAAARDTPQQNKTTKLKIAAPLKPEKGRYWKDGPVTHVS